MQIELLYPPDFRYCKTGAFVVVQELLPASLSLTRILAFGDAIRNRGRRLTMSFLRTVENNIAQVGKPETGSRVRGLAEKPADAC